MPIAFDAQGAPKLRVNIDSGNGQFRALDALIDTGASRCYLPPQLAKDLRLSVQGHVEVHTGHASTIEASYFVHLKIPGIFDGFFPFVEMPALWDMVVIGRDFLRTMRFIYDGQAGTFELVAHAYP